MLNQQKTDAKQHSHVLLNSKGNSLTHKEIKPDGSSKRVDTIVQSFRKLKRKAKVKGELSFKHFRKTGADAIEKQFQTMPWLASLYLSHDISGVIRKSYTGQSHDLLHDATDWLAQYFGFNEGGTLSGLGGNNSK